MARTGDTPDGRLELEALGPRHADQVDRVPEERRRVVIGNGNLVDGSVTEAVRALAAAIEAATNPDSAATGLRA
jgi:hypothetical protein